MKLKDRIVRTAAALSVAALIASQIPVSGTTAFAQDRYSNTDPDDSGDFLGIDGLSNRDVIQAAVFGLVAYGIAATLTGRSGTGEAAATPAANSGAVPPAAEDGDKPIWDALNDDPAKRFTEFTSITEANGLKENPLRDQSNKPYTVFAPTDAAIRALPPTTVEGLKNAQNQAANARILSYHIIQGYRYSVDDLRKMADGTKIATMNGDTVTVNTANGLQVNGVAVSDAPIPANNGVSYPIETVLFPGAGAGDAPAAPAVPAPDAPAPPAGE